MGLFGKKKRDPKKVVAECLTLVRKEKHQIERQIISLQKEEEKAKMTLKQSARHGVSDVTIRNLAAMIVTSRNVTRRLQSTKFRLDSLTISLQQERSVMRTAGAVDVSTQVMREMSALVNVPEVEKSLRKMSKELIKIGLIEESIEDSIQATTLDDDVESSPDADQHEVDKIIAESTSKRAQSAHPVAVATRSASVGGPTVTAEFPAAVVGRGLAGERRSAAPGDGQRRHSRALVAS